MTTKSEDAFRTIGELSDELGVAQHILRYWETRFAELRPMQRAGNRRYYRPADVALARRINTLLNEQGYTIKGVQKILAGGGAGSGADAPPAHMIERLRAIRDDLEKALGPQRQPETAAAEE